MSEETLGSKLGNPEDMVIDALGQKIMSEWNDAKYARQEQEKIFIRAHRNNKGVYPPKMTFSGESRAKVNITRPRVSHIASRLMEVANPIGELPFTMCKVAPFSSKRYILTELLIGKALEALKINLPDSMCDFSIS